MGMLITMLFLRLSVSCPRVLQQLRGQMEGFDIRRQTARSIPSASPFPLAERHAASGSYSLAAIAKILNQEGFRGRKGYRVGKSAIEKILKNPIYYGAFRWQGRLRDGSHPPLISKDLFDKACAALHGNARPYTNRRGFAFNNLLTCGDCGCKVLGEEKKKRFVYYHCTFSKGRHNGWGYVPEREIARLFEPTVKAVTLDEEIVEWLQDALKESDKSSRRLSENRLNSLQNDLARVNQRLSRLYDAKFDGDSIDEEVFQDQRERIQSQYCRDQGANQNARRRES